MLLSHNIFTILTAIFAGIYCILNLRSITRTRVKKGIMIDFIWILLITFFYWGPFLETKFFTNYQVFEKDAMATQESVLQNALSLEDLFITPSSEHYVFEIGIPVILMLVFSIMTIRRLKENRKEYLFFLISGLVSLWMATKYFPWKWLPNSFYIIQFPWRMLLPVAFFFSIVCSINMATLIRNFNSKDVLIIVFICMIYLFSRYGYMPYSENIIDVKDYEIVRVSGQNGEWLPGMGRLEYLPSKAYQNSFYLATRDNGIVVLEGTCEIQEETKMGKNLSAKVSTAEQKTNLELPYLYYPGYLVKLDGVSLEITETENGFLGIYLDENEQGKLEIEYDRNHNHECVKSDIVVCRDCVFNICVPKELEGKGAV